MHVDVWSLTGRADDFIFEGFRRVEDLSYTTNDRLSTCRSILRLSDNWTDFYVLGALTAVASLPESTARLSPYMLTLFAPGVLSTSSFDCSVPLLPPGRLIPAAIDQTIAGAQGFSKVTVTRSGNSCEIVIAETGKSLRSAFTTIPDAGYLRLAIPGVEELGVRAHFQVDSWEDGDRFAMTIPPEGYPYQAMAEAVAQSSECLQIMQDRGTLGLFSSSDSPVEKVGAIAAAISLEAQNA